MTVKTGKQMIIRVDRSICAGHALCFARAPDVYALDEEGFCSSDNTVVPDDKYEQAKAGAAICPERAITLAEN